MVSNHAPTPVRIIYYRLEPTLGFAPSSQLYKSRTSLHMFCGHVGEADRSRTYYGRGYNPIHPHGCSCNIIGGVCRLRSDPTVALQKQPACPRAVPMLTRVVVYYSKPISRAPKCWKKVEVSRPKPVKAPTRFKPVSQPCRE
jgi:hypothetical protein